MWNLSVGLHLVTVVHYKRQRPLLKEATFEVHTLYILVGLPTDDDLDGFAHEDALLGRRHIERQPSRGGSSKEEW
jgi:hypothetical protein